MRSDIWSLGVLLYEMTTCHLPFDANTIGELCQKITKATFTLPAVMNQNVPREVQNIIVRCLKKNPADRYQSARELLQDLNHAAAALSLPPTRLAIPAPVTAPSYSQLTSPSQQNQQTSPGPRDSSGATPVVTKQKSALPMIAVLAGVALLVVLAGIYFLLKSGPDSSSASKSPQQTNAAALPTRQVSPQTHQTYTVDVAEGRADVYRNGDLVGTTPYQFQAKSGEQLELVLKREGYLDKPVRLSTSDNKKTYTFMMERK
jgi:serine/threonine protein kinase